MLPESQVGTLYRLAQVAVTPDLVAALFVQDGMSACEVIENKLPDDAEYKYAYHDAESNTFRLVFASHSFRELKNGEEIPTLTPPTFKKVPCPNCEDRRRERVA